MSRSQRYRPQVRQLTPTRRLHVLRVSRRLVLPALRRRRRDGPCGVGDSAGDQEAERLAVVLLLPRLLAGSAHPVTGPGAAKSEEIPVLPVGDGVGARLGGSVADYLRAGGGIEFP